MTTDLIKGDVGRFTGEFLQGRTRTCAFYEGTHTDRAPTREIGGGVRTTPHYTPQYWLEPDVLVKEYTTTPNTYEKMSAGDDGALIAGMVEGNVIFDGTEPSGRIRVFQPGDILLLETDGGQTEAINEGDAISIDDVPAITATRTRHGVSVKRAAAGEVGWGRARTAVAALTAGLIMVEYCKPRYEYVRVAVNGNITVDIFPGGHAGVDGEVVAIIHGITSGTPGEFNVAIDGVDLHDAADITMVLTDEAMRPVPALAATLTVTPLSKITVDVNDAGTTCVDLMVTLMILRNDGGW